MSSKEHNVLPITSSDTTTTKGGAAKALHNNIKLWSMLILIVQNTALVLTMRYSRTVTHKNADGSDDGLYSTTSCVFFMEAVKVLVCLFIVFYEKNFSVNAFSHTIYTSLFGAPVDTLKMLVPATIYAIQNNLLFIALSNLDAAVYQVTYQLKILTTALFSVTMLNRHIIRRQWFSLMLLMFGVTLVQLELQSKQGSDPKSNQSPTKGLLAVLLACFSSGFAGVYFEKVVKSAESNIWIRNIQLGIFGTIFSFLAMIVQEGGYIWEKGIFHGYDPLVWMVVLMQALGGLVVAIVVKYADNILKGFATSLSILLSSVVSFYLSGLLPSFQFVTGTLVVLLSVFLYSLPK